VRPRQGLRWNQSLGAKNKKRIEAERLLGENL